MENKSNNEIFDYRALRLLMGLIALCLPFIVSFVASNKLPSISASYHSEARDAFVGMLFVTSAFLWAYNGHTTLQKVLSKLASIAAILVAVSPLHCSGCEVNLASTIHSISTAVLFSVLSYFCFSPFRKNTKGKGGKKGLRSKIYFVCGSIMVGCMLTMFITKYALSNEIREALRITYYAEAIALCAFGVGWTVAGKWIWFLVDEKDDVLRLFADKQ
jgi:hypothetical protein